MTPDEQALASALADTPPVESPFSQTPEVTPEVAPEVTPEVEPTVEPEAEPGKRWQDIWARSKFSNLYLHKPSARYWVIASVRGRLIRRSLKTKSLEIAKTKMDRLLAEERGRVILQPDCAWTFGDMVCEYETRLEAKVQSKEMKPRARDYRLETLKQIRATWPKIDKLPAKAFTQQSILLWATRLRQKYSPTRYNGAVQTLRGILQVAVDNGVMLSNPADSRKKNSVRGIPTASVPLSPPDLPETEEFHALLKYLDAHPARKRASRLVRALAYTGMRIEAARRLRPENFDFEANEVIVPALKYQHEPFRVPMIPEMRALAEELVRDYPGAGSVFGIKSPRRALNKACAALKIAPITPHVFRHYFSTRAMECGIDVKTCASWLGHQDGGALLSKVYAHTRKEHSDSMIKKLNFNAPRPVAAVVNVPAVPVLGLSQSFNTQSFVANQGACVVSYQASGEPVNQQVIGSAAEAVVRPVHDTPEHQAQGNSNPEPHAHCAPDGEPVEPPVTLPPIPQGPEDKPAGDDVCGASAGE